MDSAFLFGSVKDNFLNLLIDTNEWNEKVILGKTLWIEYVTTHSRVDVPDL